MINAVFFDFGGVILASPFEAFNRYETANGLPQDFIRRVNTAEPHSNAWARLERSEIDSEAFDAAFADESERLGHRVRGSDVLGLLSGQVRPEMVVALDRVIEAGYTTACLTNNVVGGEVAPGRGRRRWPASTTSSSRARSACASRSRRSTSWPAGSPA